MRRRTKIIWGAVGVMALAGAGSAVRAVRKNGADENLKTITATTASIVDKALAVGTIEPEVEVGVKSQVSGVVQRRLAEEGEYVRAGTPLLEIKPTPTPLELAEARRQVQLRDVELENLRRDLERNASLREQGLVSEQDYLGIKQRFEQVEIQRQIAAERLSLMEEGRITAGHGRLETVIRAPIDGYILEYAVEVGDPVVPISTYQEGTVLIRMAEMATLVFRGTVDEIDVGRLREGLPAELKIGALPNAKVAGRLVRISLKARTEESSTVFPVEIALTEIGETVLRAGYSASADIVVERRDSILTIPERVVTMRGDTARVTVLLPDGRTEERTITLGLSDAINVEVRAGLVEGDRVVEPPPREIK